MVGVHATHIHMPPQTQTHTETPGQGKTQDTQKNMARTTAPDVKPGQLYENFIKHPSTLKRF